MASLQLLELDEAGPIAAATLPGIERLTALQDLELTYCDLEPYCLLPMTTGLTRLYLQCVTLQPRQAQQGGALGASHLLQLLGRCSALQKLKLDSISGDWPQQLSAYSALTASSNLQELHIYDSSIPGAALAHMFPAGRQLPKLRTLTLLRDDHSLSPVGSADIARLVSCCPAVEDLTFTPAADASLAPLQSLTALTSLANIGPVSPAVMRSDLTATSQLQSLWMSVSLPAAGAGQLQHLLPLTALTGLTHLTSSSCALVLVTKAPAGAPPDVWVQLLERCAADQAAQPAVISSVVQQLQQQHDQVAQQAIMLDRQEQEHRQELAAARAEAAAEAAELRGQLAAAGAEAAELRGRVQAMEGQLQEVLAVLKQQRQA